MEEVHIQDYLTHGRSRARILQVAKFFRTAGISGGVGYANDATALESTPYEPCYDYYYASNSKTSHSNSNSKRNSSNISSSNIAESDTKTKVKKINLRKKYNWI